MNKLTIIETVKLCNSIKDSADLSRILIHCDSGSTLKVLERVLNEVGVATIYGVVNGTTENKIQESNSKAIVVCAYECSEEYFDNFIGLSLKNKKSLVLLAVGLGDDFKTDESLKFKEYYCINDIALTVGDITDELNKVANKQSAVLYRCLSYYLPALHIDGKRTTTQYSSVVLGKGISEVYTVSQMIEFLSHFSRDTRVSLREPTYAIIKGSQDWKTNLVVLDIMTVDYQVVYYRNRLK